MERKTVKSVISNTAKLSDLSDVAALKDIQELVEKKILIKRGRGPGTHYVLAR